MVSFWVLGNFVVLILFSACVAGKLGKFGCFGNLGLDLVFVV